MKYVNPKDFINEELPVINQRRIYKAICRAYRDSIKIIEENEKLNWLGGKELLPYIRRALVEFELIQLCEENILKYDYRMTPNKKENCHHLEIRTDNSIVTISHVNRKKSLPRKAVFRKDLSIFNRQISLFEEDKKLDVPYHLILTHGYKNEAPDFAYIGMPESNERKWMEYINIKEQTLSIVEGNTDVVSITDDIDLGVKKEFLINRGVLDNDN